MTPSTPTLGDLHGAVRRELPGWALAVVGDAAATLAQAALEAPSSGERHAAADAAALLRDGAAALARAWALALQQALGAAPGRDEPRAAPAATLSLVDEDQIDADIETFRIARDAEDSAEAELRRLAPLASRLQQRDGVVAEAVPLPPLACARTLRQALAEFAPPREHRARLVGALGQALAGRLPALYAAQIRLLERWGVEPARYRIRQTVSAVGVRGGTAPAPATPPAADPALSPDLVASLNRLVAWAQRHPDAQAAPAEDAPLRLLDEPVALAAAGAAPPRLPPAMGRQLMQHLFDQVGRQTGDGAEPAWMAPMKAAGERLAGQSAEVWNDFQHPWWQLLDRLLALAALRDDGDPGVEQAIAGTLDRLQAAPALARRDVAAAVAQIDRSTTDWMAARECAFGERAAPLAGAADRQPLEDVIRDQLVARLRAEPPPDGLRRFLLGPWAQAMAHAALHDGADGATLAAQAACLEQLLAAGREVVSREERRVLLARARAALEAAGVEPARVDAELLDLAAVLRRPEPPCDPGFDAEPVRETAPMDLATVPIDMYEQDAGVDREAWLDALAPGARCRLYVDGRWHTAGLAWVSPNRGLFVFGSRHGAGIHPLTRRALDKLRNAGLATTLLPGELLAEAMDRVTDLGELGAL